MLHPKWCNELQLLWSDTIPISEHMGIKIYQYTGRTFETRASLNKNINIHGTMFAGSIFSLATLTGWGMLHLLLKQKGLSGDIMFLATAIFTIINRSLCNREQSVILKQLRENLALWHTTRNVHSSYKSIF